MGSIIGLLNKIEAIDTDAICERAVDDSVNVMADLNAEQINSGLKADGSEMPDYSLRSVVQYGKPYGPIRLRETGAWQAGLYAVRQGDSVVFKSSDPKDGMLTGRYGDDIEGLSEKYKNEAIREAVRPAFKKRMEEATGLKMK